MIRTQSLLLRPSKEQEQLFLSSVGLSRLAWNWALSVCQRHYRWFGKRSGFVRSSAFTLISLWNRVKHAKYKFHVNHSKYVAEEAIKNLDKAFQKAFRDGKKKKGSINLPKFKSKHRAIKSFCVCPSNCFPLTVKNDRIRIPRIGLVKIVNKLRWPHAKQVYGQVKLTAGRWWLTLTYELTDPTKLEANRPSCGIDLGSTTFATISSGGKVVERVAPPKPYAKAKRKIKRQQRALDRYKMPSNRRDRRKLRLSKTHEKTRNIRDWFLHNLTSKITKQFGRICVEDLNVKGMQKGFLAGAIQDLGFYEFRRQIQYKSETTGSEVWLADRFFPSSKTCSCCGNVKKDLSLEVREYACENCGLVIDRDDNAAINLEKLPTSSGKVTRVETGSSLTFRKKGRGAGRGDANVSQQSSKAFR